MNKHTPAPWELRGNKIFVPKTFRSIAIVCVQNNFDILKWKAVEDIEAIANAERITTCVNAMEGLTNEEVVNIRSVNAELLEALEDMLKAAIHCDSFFEIRWKASSDKAKQAIKNSKEKI
jgi:hypothetical protein